MHSQRVALLVISSSILLLLLLGGVEASPGHYVHKFYREQEAGNNRRARHLQPGNGASMIGADNHSTAIMVLLAALATFRLL